jgi:hypothetical protein
LAFISIATASGSVMSSGTEPTMKMPVALSPAPERLAADRLPVKDVLEVVEPDERLHVERRVVVVQADVDRQTAGMSTNAENRAR